MLVKTEKKARRGDVIPSIYVCVCDRFCVAAATSSGKEWGGQVLSNHAEGKMESSCILFYKSQSLSWILIFRNR